MCKPYKNIEKSCPNIWTGTVQKIFAKSVNDELFLLNIDISHLLGSKFKIEKKKDSTCEDDQIAYCEQTRIVQTYNCVNDNTRYRTRPLRHRVTFF